MTTVYQYRIWCTTDSKWEYTFGTSPPTTCPTNTAHGVNLNSAQQLKKISNERVEIIEETTPTGGFYQIKNYPMTIPINSTVEEIIIFPHPITALEMHFVSTSMNTDDVLSVCVGKNTIVGTLTADLVAKPTWTSQNYLINNEVTYQTKVYKCILDTVSQEVPTNATYWTSQSITIAVSQTVIDNMKIGFYARLNDLTNQDDLGTVCGIDTNNNTITVVNAYTNSYTAATPTYVDMSVFQMKDYTFCAPRTHVVGRSKIGGSYVPANTPISIIYKNTSMDTEKHFTGAVEFLY